MLYKLKKQERDDYCMASGLQAVLIKYGISLSQKYIARQLKIKGKGARVEQVEKFLRKYNFNSSFYNYDKTPFNEPDFLLEDALSNEKDVLIAVKNSRGRHILLLENFDGFFLSARDPKDTKLYIENIYHLMRKMHSENNGGFFLIEKL